MRVSRVGLVWCALYLACPLIACPKSALAQAIKPVPVETSSDTAPTTALPTEAPPRQAKGWAAFPGLSYSPDDGLTLTGAFLQYFSLPGERERPSVLKFNASLSIEGNRELSTAVDLWPGDGTYNLELSAGINDTERAFFGLGNESRSQDREDYRARRANLRARFARRLTDRLYLAFVYDFGYLKIAEAEAGGAIDTQLVLGSEGGAVSGAGLELRYDTRDRIFSPTDGIHALATARWYSEALGTAYEFATVYAEASRFCEIAPEHVLAFDVQGELRSRGAPFEELALAGGSRLLRGMLRGRFRDHYFLGSQVEYRSPLIWRLGAVAFLGTGRVAHRLRDIGLSGWKYSVGGGLRFQVDDQGLKIRADVGLSEGETGVYFGLLEAF